MVNPTTPPLRKQAVELFPTPETPSKYKSLSKLEIDIDDAIRTPESPDSPSSPTYVRGNKTKLEVELEKLNREEFVAIKNFTLHPLNYQVKVDKMLGIGSFANVLNGQLNAPEGQSVVAVKIPISNRKINYVLREALILSELNNVPDSPFIRCYGLLNMTKSQYNRIRVGDLLPCLLLEKMSFNLEQSIQAFENPDPYDIHITKSRWWDLCVQLVKSLIIMKDLSIVHADLKSSNVLMNEDGAFKVCDFSSSNFSYNIKSSDMITTTLEFSSPDLLGDSTPSFQTDLYSVGMVLLHAAIGRKPFYSVDSSNNIYFINLVKNNSVLKLLAPEDWNRIRSDPNAEKLLYMILVERVELETVRHFVEEIYSREH